jgi:hypothetical protein
MRNIMQYDFMSHKTVSIPALPSIAEQRKDEQPLFAHEKMLPPINKYVCWIDVMGSQSVMLRSLNMSAHFLMKLHLASLHAHDSLIELFPVIDGIYACSSSQKVILNFINKVNAALAITFILEPTALHKFMIRSGLAYGPVITGKETLACANELRENSKHISQVFFGPPLTQAFQIEKKAAPFGVTLHESVRSFAPNKETPMSGTYWKWWKHPQEDALALELFDSLKKYYRWCLEHTALLSYEKADIERHVELAKEYFSE